MVPGQVVHHDTDPRSRNKGNFGNPAQRGVVFLMDERRSIVNVPRAEQLMRAAAVEALVAVQPVNVYYCSGFWSVLHKMGFDFAGAAVLPREPSRGAALIASASQLWRLSLREREYPERIIPVTAPANDRSLHNPDAPGVHASAWPVSAQETDWSAIQRGWVMASRAAAGNEAATTIHGIARALRDCRLTEARVATDDPRLAGLLAVAGLERVECRYLPNLFRRLRMVKSEVELGLMREAARRNADSAIATARQITAGMTMRDIETQFRIETAKRGAETVFVVAGGTGLLPHGEVRRGEPLLIDAVSHYQHYHGDFGRTVVVGEPGAEVRRRVDALRIGWQASFEALRPGRKYSEISQAGLDAIAKAGYRYLTVAHPHSVGLQHTDEPFRDDSPFELKDDIVLEQGMTLTVDFPHLDVGFGACHLEDLVEITADGARPLANMDEPLIVV